MLVQPQSLAQHLVLPPLKSFLLWSATLTACSLAFYLPLGLLLVAIALLFVPIAQSWQPLSQTFSLLQSFAGLNLLLILSGAIACSLRGLRPHQVRWLHRLNPKSPTVCPLTCKLRD